MKKLSLFIVAILFAVACSTDNQETNVNDANTVTASTKREGVDLSELYNSMIQSRSYNEFIEAADSFSSKMNFDGVSTDIDTEDELLGWISTNISKTTFRNYYQAVDEFDNVKRLSQVNLENNYSFFAGLTGGRSNDLIAIIRNPEPPVSPNNCSGCIADFKSCTSQATSGFATTTSEVADGLESGTMTGTQANQKMSLARVLFKIEMGVCSETFEQCCFA